MVRAAVPRHVPKMAMAIAPAQQATVPNASIDTKHEDMIVSGLNHPARRGASAPRVRAGAPRDPARARFCRSRLAAWFCGCRGLRAHLCGAGQSDASAHSGLPSDTKAR
jgi:hypothetical protein